MEPQAKAQELPSDPKAIAAGLAGNSLQFDASSAVTLLMQVQSGFDSKAISEKDYLFAQAELLKKIAPSESPS